MKLDLSNSLVWVIVGRVATNGGARMVLKLVTVWDYGSKSFIFSHIGMLSTSLFIIALINFV